MGGSYDPNLGTHNRNGLLRVTWWDMHFPFVIYAQVEVVGAILCPNTRYTDPTSARVVLMDFEITSGVPDGICVRAEFWVETWEDLAKLMRHLGRIEEVLLNA